MSLCVSLHQIRDIFNEHRVLISDLAQVGLNALIFVSRAFQSIPRIFETLPYTISCYTGLFYLEEGIKTIYQRSILLKKAFLNHAWKPFVLTCFRIATWIADNSLLLCTAFATTLTLFGGAPIALAVFAVCKPIAIGSLILRCVLKIIDVWQNRRILKQWKQCDADLKNRCITQIHRSIKGKRALPQNPLAQKMLFALDYYSYNKLKEIADSDIKDKKSLLKKKMIKSVKIGSLNAKQDLAMEALGYVAQFFCKLHPRSVIDSGIYLGFSIWYAGKQLIKKVSLYRNYKKTNDTRSDALDRLNDHQHYSPHAASPKRRGRLDSV